VGRPFRPEGLVLGVVLVVVGSLWMAANLGRLDLLSTLRTWWPASLIFWGAVELVAVLVERARGEK
jgi:cell wall-active antibiotic response 4TMS protein YvqF